MSGSSPASTGPAGARFEGQVGAHYFLTMLGFSEPRGLPGTTIDRVELQRANDGFPLDDVILRAHENTTGRTATLQIQVKRSIAFSPSDAVFKKVVEQIAKAIAEPNFWVERHELAIATARGSRKIDGAFQDALKWARQIDSAPFFFSRLKSSGNSDMRTFVQTLRDNLRDCGALHDNETVWKVLGRLQILVFDYTAVGSAAEELARERALRVLPPEDTANASTLWSVLTDLAEEIAGDGGDRDRERLIADIVGKSIRIAGDRRLVDVRSAVAEASRQALADIDNRIGATNLTRRERVEAAHQALDHGRYVEIRGDAGVGKSGVLKHIAELFEAEGRVVVLSPSRTVPRGWTAMRSQLGFNGTARELLGELALDGGAVLFIDNLDSFNDEERRTVNDLLRAASEVPGFSVIVTARRNFGVDEPSWLAADAVEALRPVPPVVIEELSEAEVAELTEAEPRLGGLLTDGHPARDVVRNLYRLSRLACLPASVPTPTTELDMAEQWWSSADGRRDAEHRGRARLLRSLAEMALGGEFALDVKDKEPAPIDALIKSGTLRDLGNDRVAFRHDVLRQWAVGNLLTADEAAFERLALDKPASAILERGVELSARFALEREPNSCRWAALLDRLSKDGVHGSWRRAVLLALVHSETSDKLLDRESARLLDNDAALLCELIRTVMAVDVEPVSQLLVQFGVDPAQVPPGLFVPTGAAWLRLIIWLSKLGAKVPAHALRDVADFYTKWMLGTLGHGPLTPMLLAWLHAWLVELEESRGPGVQSRSYSGKFGYREEQGLTDKLRTTFLMFCNKVPDLAVDYLNRVRGYKDNSNAVSSIINFRGTLAQAAPKELAALTAEGLIARKTRDDGYRSARFEEPFLFLDHEFLPAAPAQGPFLELLVYAPTEGLALIRQLVDHGIQFVARGKDPGDNGLLLHFDDGDRFFPWTQTYRWSRGDSNYCAVGSGLMALEAWAHQRIEAADDFKTVLKEVLGPPGTSAAFVLIAVDLIISHWPNSQAAAIPFLGCPELLSIDRARQAADQIEYPDILGLKALEKEPVGGATLASLKHRPSRRYPLENLIGTYACFGPHLLRAKLEAVLQAVSQYLDEPEPTSTFADPRLMVRHALNLVDPRNWRECEVRREDGTTVMVHQYVAPEAEERHVTALQAGADTNLALAGVHAALLQAVDSPSHSSADLAARGVAWARQVQSQPKDDDKEDGHYLKKSIPAAALVAIRDGTDDLRRDQGRWAEQVLMETLDAVEDTAQWMRQGLKFNPVAIAFAGIAELYRREPTPERLRVLLKISARKSPAGAQGFWVAASSLASVDERIPKAVIRCAFSAAVKPVMRGGVNEEELLRRSTLYSEQVAKSIDDEIGWINGSNPEPVWPNFEEERSNPARIRRPGLRVGGPPLTFEAAEKVARPTTYVDEQAAALWINALRLIIDVSKRPWLRDLVMAYAAFSSNLNGLNLGPDVELSQHPHEWNASYYPLLAHALIGLSEAEIDELALKRILELPDEPFFNITPPFLRTVDAIYFNDCLLESEAPHIRQRFIDRLKTSSGWRRLVGTRSGSIEIRLGPAIGAVFFNDYVLRLTKTYLTAKAIERIGPFLSQLIDLLTVGPSYFAAAVTMDLLEISPRPSLLPLLVAGSNSWLCSYSDDAGFWVEHGIGRRFCAWVDHIRQAASDKLAAGKPERQCIDEVLAALIRLGVPEARQLESKLAGI